MAEASSSGEVFDELAYEFAERLRAGEHPSLTEYVQRHPELAEEIHELFPSLLMMEKLGDRADRSVEVAASSPITGGPPPDRLGDYRIIREVGRGGMGVVYEAVQESLGRRVALKVLSQLRHVGSVQLIRFEREARAAAVCTTPISCPFSASEWTKESTTLPCSSSKGGVSTP